MATYTISGYLYGFTMAGTTTTLSIASSGYVAGGGVYSNQPKAVVTVVNSGTLSGIHYGAHIVRNGVVINALNGHIDGRTDPVYESSSYGNTFANYGTVGQGIGGESVRLQHGGTVTNAGQGVIVGSTYLGAATASKVTNSGVMGYLLADGAGVILNNTYGQISGVFQGAGSLTNYGTIAAAYATPGVVNQSGGAVTNLGKITGGKQGVLMASGGGVANGSPTQRNAVIRAEIGVQTNNFAGTVTNFGTIAGDVHTGFGVVLSAGGQVTNGSASATAAVISGSSGIQAYSGGEIRNYGRILGVVGFDGMPHGRGGVALTNGTLVNGGLLDTTALVQGYNGVVADHSTLQNFGEIQAVSRFGVLLSGGALTNGTADDTTALVTGYLGAYLYGSAAGVNYGRIQGGSEGLLLNGASLANGSAASRAATIAGGYRAAFVRYGTLGNFGQVKGGSDAAVVLVDGGVLDNFGTVSAAGGAGVRLLSTSARLIAHDQSAVQGLVVGGGGTLELASGTGTIAGLGSAGTVSGGVAMSFSGFGTYAIDPGGSWTLAGTDTVGASQRLSVRGGLTITGTLAGVGTIALAGGADRIAGATVSATHLSITNSTVTLAGTIANSGTITAVTGHVIVDAAGASLEGGGRLGLTNAATNKIAGATATATLTNVDNLIAGGGQLGGGQMTLVNQAAGRITGNVATKLIIDTGANAIANAGTITANAGGGVEIKSAIVNTGRLMAAATGTLTLDQAVTGAGSARILGGGTLAALGTFSEGVAFLAATGTLKLAHSTSYTGGISGFSKTGGTSLDLMDIAFTSGVTIATYKDNGLKTGGTLTVSDGTHTAKIRLVGDYSASTFNLASDGHSGTMVTDPPAAGPASASTAAALPPFVQAMAGFAGPTAAYVMIPRYASMAPHGFLAGPRTMANL